MARTTASTGIWHEALLGGPSLVSVGRRVFTAGLMARDQVSLESEAHQVFRTLAGLLREADASLADVVRTRLYYVGDEGERGLQRIHGIVFNRPGPAYSAIRVARLPRDARMALEVEAIRGSAGEAAQHRPDDASASSRAIRVGDEVFVGGITAGHGDASSPALDHSSQMEAVFADAAEALEALGVSPADVTATRHYYSFEQRDAPEGAGHRRQLEFMSAGEPTSAGICVSCAGPPGTTFAFECEAVAGAARCRKNLRTGRTFEVEHNYSRSVRVGDVVYVAGTTSTVPGEIVRHPGEVRGQVLDSLETIRRSIEEQGLAWRDLVRTRSHVVGGPEKLDEAAAALREAVGETGAVATLTGVPVLGRPEIVVEIEATAVWR